MTKAEEAKFWQKQRPESRIKALLVSNYFPQYCRILNRGMGAGLVYMDFWAGRGKYDDGSLSTPLLLGDIIKKDEELRRHVQFAFNDLNNRDILKKNFEERFPPGTFEMEPRFGDFDAEKSEELRAYLNKAPKPGSVNKPTLLFFDPFGYAGIDTASLANFLKPYGNELFLFLNVNRVIPALTNPKMEEHIRLMFPHQRDEVVDSVTAATTDERKVSLLIQFLSSEFKSVVGDSLIPCAFKFMESGANRTSHLIIHFCKHPSGYKLVKQVYYDYDNIGATLGVDGTFTFDAKKAYPTGVIDFSMDDNHINLAEQLSKHFAGQKLTAASLIDKHHPASPYAPTHYVKALRRLVEQGRLEAIFTDDVDHKVTVLPSPFCHLTFPAINGSVVN